MESINKEVLESAKKAESYQEIKELAKENGYEIDDREANSIFEYLHKNGELTEEELDNVSGGGCNDSGDTPKYHVGQIVYCEENIGYWYQCQITWVSPTKKTFGLIFKDHMFTYNVIYTKHRKGYVFNNVTESTLSLEPQPWNPKLP